MLGFREFDTHPISPIGSRGSVAVQESILEIGAGTAIAIRARLA